jgi:AbiV family abortive infection protein
VSRKPRLREIDLEVAPAAAGAALDNSSDLLRSAEIIAADAKFGLATALVIASIEEIGKALGLQLQVELDAGLNRSDPAPDEEVVSSHHSTAVFDDHQLKKMLVFSFIPSLAVYRALGASTKELSIEKTDKILREIEQLRPIFEEGRPPSDIDQKGHPIAHGLLNFLVQSYLIASEYERLRQRGLYVDIHEKSIESPRDASQGEYASMRAYADEALKLARFALAKGLPKSLLQLLVTWVERNAIVTIVEHDETGKEITRRTRKGLRETP